MSKVTTPSIPLDIPIPEKTQVLVVGGGPGGSYSASAIAREGFNVTLLEGDIFPRYHVGESMVVSIRHFLRFIDLDETFNKHGFIKKTGAAFKLNNQKAAYTDFIVNAGPNSYAWNVIRSECDDLIFRHAGNSGAKIFDGTKVTSIEFASAEGPEDPEVPNGVGRPVAANWQRKDGTTGTIKFDYIVDASGRFGIMSTKYLKNRSFNQDLKNVASWGYWKGAIQYGVGTPKEGQPFFEALSDGSGWVWFIPLHNGTVSVGVVMNQKMSVEKKQAAELSPRDFYTNSIKEAKGVNHLLEQASLDTEIKHASDWSYNASCYGSPYCRIVGDAGAFIDPYFSSGVHLAFSGALSAAASVCASLRGDAPENIAWKWHSHQVAERYTRFLLVVLSATKQIRHQDKPVLNNAEDDGFDEAFSIIRPVIQGIDSVPGRTTHSEVAKTVDFTMKAVENGNVNANKPAGDWQLLNQDTMDPEEKKVMKMVKDVFKDYFTEDVYGGMVANMEHGNLTLKKAPQMSSKTESSADSKAPTVQATAVAAEVAA